MWKKIPPPKKKGQRCHPHFSWPPWGRYRPDQPKERVDLDYMLRPFPGSKSSRNEHRHFFWSSEVGSPRPTWDPYMTPNTMYVPQYTPKGPYIVHIMCIRVAWHIAVLKNRELVVRSAIWVMGGTWLGVVWGPYGPFTTHPIHHSHDAPRHYRRCLEAVYGVYRC